MCDSKMVFSRVWTTSFVLFSACFGSTEWVFPKTVDACPDPNTRCISIEECQPIIEELNNKRKEYHSILKSLTCGFNDRSEIPKVCCPKDYGISGMEGSCRDMKDSPVLRRFVEKKTVRDIFINSKCKGQSVCSPKTPKACVATSLPSPRRECCGLEKESYRISGGRPTGVDQYPWTVIVKYKNGRIQNSNRICGGSLISGRYVLTAAHCALEEYSGEIDHVVIGEYDTEHPGPDCEDRGGSDYCTEGERKIKVSKTIAHPDYSSNEPHMNDIALLQLDKMASFTDFVQPVCLPSGDAAVSAKRPMFVMGWGSVNQNVSLSNTKLAAKVYHMGIEICSSTLLLKLSKKNLCAKGKNGEGPCSGDSGGPLVQYTGNNYELKGIHSYGTVGCGLRWPGVYTNVAEYLDWINDMMEREEINK